MAQRGKRGCVSLKELQVMSSELLQFGRHSLWTESLTLPDLQTGCLDYTCNYVNLSYVWSWWILYMQPLTQSTLIAYMKVLLPTWTSSEDPDLWPLSLLSWEQTFKILTASSHLNLRRAEPSRKTENTFPSGAYYKLTFVMWLSLKALSLSGVTILSRPGGTALLKRHLELCVVKSFLSKCMYSADWPWTVC